MDYENNKQKELTINLAKTFSVNPPTQKKFSLTNKKGTITDIERQENKKSTRTYIEEETNKAYS